MTRRQSLAVVALLLLVATFEVARSLTRLDGVVFAGYTQLGEVVLRGDPPYGLPINTWPPFFLFVAAGLALLARVSLAGALLLWQVGAVLAIWGSCRLLARFFEDQGDRVAFSSVAVLVPVLMTARLFQEHLQHTQVNLFLVFLALLAFHLFREGRPALGGLALGVAASAKAMPALLLLYFVYKRRWRETAWAVAFLVALNVLLPAVAFGPDTALEHWRTWRAVAAAEIAGPTTHYPNQSLLAAVKRLLTTEGGARDPVRYAVAALSPAAAVGVFWAVAGLAALGLALAFRGGTTDLGHRRSAAEYAAALGAMTLVSPLAWKAQYVALLAPYWAAWWGLRHLDPGPRARRAWWVLWWTSFACLTLSAPLLVGERVNNVLESLNVILVGAACVLGLVVWQLRSPSEQLSVRRAG